MYFVVVLRVSSILCLPGISQCIGAISKNIFFVTKNGSALSAKAVPEIERSSYLGVALLSGYLSSPPETSTPPYRDIFR